MWNFYELLFSENSLVIFSECHQQFRFSAQIDIFVTSVPISLGTSYVSVFCMDNDYRRFFGYEDFEMILQFRQNKTNEWETIVKVNDVGSFITNKSTAIETHFGRKKPCGYRLCTIDARISIHMNTCENNFIPSFRCQIRNGRNSVDSSREVQLEITGKWVKNELKLQNTNYLNFGKK